jgi:hypothetical protein
MAKAKSKGPGRPPGTPNLKSAYPRDENFGPMRCSTGFNKVVEEILQSGSTKYKSKADVLHAALEILAKRELPATYFFINKIQ